MFNGNYIDLIILLVLTYFALQGTRSKLKNVVADLVAFATSLVIALSFYRQASVLFVKYFSLSKVFSDALGFLFTAVIAETILGTTLESVFSKFKTKIHGKLLDLVKAILSLVEGLIFVAFVLLLVIALPVNPKVKRAVSESEIGSSLVQKGAGVEKLLNEIFGRAVSETISYLTIEPRNDLKVSLQSEVGVLVVDAESESQMLTLINFERRKEGLPDLTIRQELVPVAQAHARDMWERSYFSHFSPEGMDAGDRLDASGITYFIAGENLALAPTAQTAHVGLMNSEGHKANILGKDFSHVGVGVIDNGIYGKIFVQIFTD